MDITFWNLDFSEKRILPANGSNDRYSCMNATIEFNGNGSFELIFNSKRIRDFVKGHPEGFFVVWGDFHGYATDYQSHSDYRIFGSHLNALIHKIVIPTQKTVIDIQTMLERLLPEWLVLEKDDSITAKPEYQSDTYLNGDVFVQEYLSTVGFGYQIYIEKRTLKFRLLQPHNSALVLSENNLNIYDKQEDFSNKNVAYGGWYKQTENDDGSKLDTEQWKYISVADKDGIYIQDTVLRANAPAKAMQELKEHIFEHDIMCKTRKIEYGKDYSLGDVVTLQSDDYISKKQITSVDLWYEGASYHTEPTLSEWEV